MNAGVHQGNLSRFEKLAKPKKRVDKNSNYNAFTVKRGALSYQITDSLNKLAKPKWKAGINVSNVSNSNVTNSSRNSAKQVYHKLINSNEQSKDAQETKKKKFLLDTYARITAARNKGCSKRLHELAKPKHSTMRTEPYEDFENYYQTIKSYDAKPLPVKNGPR
ncbi:uncharacterized protein LOC143429650 [Xylocopa sonorina]|uniref:uncharacterized protein LOC143429650 n=1 Tax=Xylocopa sonorina TaxID=1818115 RepID=UPI00403AB486